MQYLGGKSKIRKEVSAFLESIREKDQVYFEPFVGGASILQEMRGTRIASDGNYSLIALYKAIQDGWIPPEYVSEETWREHKKIEGFTDDPMHAFCRIGCAFGGDWNGGYARSDGRPCYAAISQRSLLKQKPLLENVHFESRMYNEWHPYGMLVYCDPPYVNTTQYGAFDGFDHEMFWDIMRDWNKSNTVVISEYVAPDDFICVKEVQSKMRLTIGKRIGKKRPIRIERLFMHESQAHLATKNDLF